MRSKRFSVRQKSNVFLGIELYVCFYLCKEQERGRRRNKGFHTLQDLDNFRSSVKMLCKVNFSTCTYTQLMRIWCFRILLHIFTYNSNIFLRKTTTITNNLCCVTIFSNFFSNFAIVVVDVVLFLPNSSQDFLTVSSKLSVYKDKLLNRIDFQKKLKNVMYLLLIYQRLHNRLRTLSMMI